jgi:NHL repeat
MNKTLAPLSFACLLTLAACGGGSGASTSASPGPVGTTPPPATPQPSRLHPVVVAGAAHQNNGGDFADGVGTNARFSNITGLAMDKAGNIYVADSGNCAIRKISPAGAVSTLAGTGKCENFDDAAVALDGKGQQARFYKLGAMTVDTGGNLYVNDRAAIRRIAPDGSVSTLAGILRPTDPAVDGTGSAARFQGIASLAMAPSGVLTVVDYTHNEGVDHWLTPVCPVPNGYNTLREVTPQGVVTTVPGTSADCNPAKTANPLTQASGVRFDKAGNLWLLHLQTLAKRPAGGAAAIVNDAAGQPITNTVPGTTMEIAPDDFGNLYYRIGATVTKLGTDGVKLEVVASRADAPVDVTPDMSLEAMSNLTYVGNHEFLISVNNQVVKLTLK